MLSNTAGVHFPFTEGHYFITALLLMHLDAKAAFHAI